MERIARGLLSWASILEDQAREQAIATAGLPFISPHLALMPDAHWGMGSTVGSVIPTIGVVMPATVGVDQGWATLPRKQLRTSEFSWCSRIAQNVICNAWQVTIVDLTYGPTTRLWQALDDFGACPR